MLFRASISFVIRLLHTLLHFDRIQFTSMDLPTDGMLFKLFAGPARLVRPAAEPDDGTIPFRLFRNRISNIQLSDDNDSEHDEHHQDVSGEERQRIRDHRPRGPTQKRDFSDDYFVLEESDIEFELPPQGRGALQNDEPQTSEQEFSAASSSETTSDDDSDTDGTGETDSTMRSSIPDERPPQRRSLPSLQDQPNGSRDVYYSVTSLQGRVQSSTCTSQQLSARPASEEFTPSDSPVASMRRYLTRRRDARQARRHDDFRVRREPSSEDTGPGYENDNSTTASSSSSSSESTSSTSSGPIRRTRIDRIINNASNEPSPKSQVQPAPSFDFLGLPKELRDAVYRYFVPSRITASIYHSGIFEPEALLPPIFRINAQIRAEALALLYAGTYVLRFEPCGPACDCRVAKHNSSVQRKKIVHKPSALMDEKFAKIHEYADLKSFTPAQKQALRSFSHIHVSWVLGKYEFPTHGIWGPKAIVKLLATEIMEAVADGSREVELTFDWSWLSPNGTVDTPHLRKLQRWAEDFRKKKFKVRVLGARARNINGRWQLRSKLALSVQKPRGGPRR